MLISSITLQNVRRFVEPVTIRNIGAGLNVLSAPNEAGKSTFFRALHAGFFLRHRSFDKTVKALIPNVGGDPEITISFAQDGAQWRLHKKWSSAPARRDAKLWKDGVLLAQKDAAEEQLAALVAAPANGGPAALLWVEQGLVEIDAGGEEQKARQDIMKLVAGEVETMTVGRRMEQAIKTCEANLAANFTSTGKDKKGGPLATARENFDKHDAQCHALTDAVRDLQDSLDTRRKLRKELAEISDASVTAVQMDRLEVARAAFDAARLQNLKVEAARDALKASHAKMTNAEERAQSLENAVKAHADATDIAARANADWTAAKEAKTEANAALAISQDAFKSAQKVAEQAAGAVRGAMRFAAAKGAQAQREDLARRIAAAQVLGQDIAQLAQNTQYHIDAATLARLEALAVDVAVAEKARDAAAPSFELSYSEGGVGHATVDGVAVEDGARMPVVTPVRVALDGIGALTIFPNDGLDSAAIDAARDKLREALAASGQISLEAARVSHQEGAEIMEVVRDKTAELGALAPDGIDALRTRLAALPQAIEMDGDTLDVPTAEAAEATAQDALHQTRITLASAQDTFDTAQRAYNSADRDKAAAEAQSAASATALHGIDDPQKERAKRHEVAQRATHDWQVAQDTLEALQSRAADFGAAETALKRAEKVIENTRARTQELERNSARLDERINLSTSEAPEEALALAIEKRSAAQSRLDEIEFDMRVNRRLWQALDTARRATLEAHVKPVADELQPLLRMLWPDAEPEVDPETGVIAKISRRSVVEDFEILSGGTREQISLMVRLAFANILAKQGRPAPVILDDAIVYTDDDRIEQMFNALTRRADDMQIIVFSCRQRAFLDLGGDLLKIEQAESAT